MVMAMMVMVMMVMEVMMTVILLMAATMIWCWWQYGWMWWWWLPCYSIYSRASAWQWFLGRQGRPIQSARSPEKSMVKVAKKKMVKVAKKKNDESGQEKMAKLHSKNVKMHIEYFRPWKSGVVLIPASQSQRWSVRYNWITSFPTKHFIWVVMKHTWWTVSERRSILARRFSPHDIEADLRDVDMDDSMKLKRSGQSVYPFHQISAIFLHWHSIWNVPKSLTVYWWCGCWFSYNFKGWKFLWRQGRRQFLAKVWYCLPLEWHIYYIWSGIHIYIEVIAMMRMRNFPLYWPLNGAKTPRCQGVPKTMQSFFL